MHVCANWSPRGKGEAAEAAWPPRRFGEAAEAVRRLGILPPERPPMHSFHGLA
jgi:hypothetical protein